MKRLSDDVIHFFQNQGFAIVTTVSKEGNLHNSCKGIVKIDGKCRIYLLDLYRQRTYENLEKDSRISITFVDEHKFRGYCLEGIAKIIDTKKLKPNILKSWEDKITSRITTRILRNIHGEKGHSKHPEALLPKPEYLIVMEVKEIIDLAPGRFKNL